jgi:hypothetical protein
MRVGFTDQDLKRGPPEYSAELSTSQPLRSITIVGEIVEFRGPLISCTRRLEVNDEMSGQSGSSAALDLAELAHVF